MYRVLCDGLPIYDLRDENLVLIDPKLDLEVNKAGSFSFKMPPQHPQYELPQKMLSCIQVFQDEEEVFNGRITECKIDFYNRKHFTCEGQLAYLNDSIQRPAEYHDMTVRGYLESLITSHNEQVKKDRQFKVGIVTVTDNNDSLYRYTNYNSTMKEIKEDLVDDLGGYLRVRNVNGTAYLDYISDYDNVSTQSIEFGENLLDFSRNTDVSDIATVFIPLGAKLEESPIAALEQRLTIESVNNGSDSLVNLDAVKKFGYITKTITWDEVTTPKMLLYKANKYIADYQWDSMTLEVNAVDMHWTGADIEQFKLGDKIKVHSSLHGLDRYFPLSKMSIQLNNLSRSKFTLGTVVNTKLTAKSQTISNTASKAVETIPVPSAIVKQAVDQAAALITAATHGHVVTTANEQLIMDTNDVNTARKVWRWNLNGLGYSSTGYNGQYATAITMDGQIVGERLVGGSVSAEKLDVSYKTSVEKKISDAQDNAEGYTDDQLKSYWTKTEVETAIKNTGDAVLLSAKETATAYTDNKLKNYSTSAQIKVTTDAITSEVNKKLNASEFSTKIQQNAYSVKIAWNNISKYIQFESGELRIYDSAVTSSQKLVSKFNYNGCHFYRDDYYVGKIGTNNLQSDSSKKGLNFDLEYNGSYMTWASKDSSSSNVYTMKWTYVQKNKGWGNYTAGELHAGCNIDMHGWTLKNPSFEGGGITGTMTFVQVLGVSSDGKLSSWSNNCKLQFKNGILISGTWYSG
ncbi:MAG: phage tail protein [Anaerobutyricum hallii]|uniref:phage tail protein n=1 Tax=Anaerobutyricum hallii TaxID=39488 RepID=UPI002431A716|nr:phage tail protein [Anaerobutyricum hallii]MDD6589986.1 phage tail protein [Anaerobutyricum hallii]